MKIDNQTSRYIYILKGILILTIICAHTASIFDSKNIFNQMASVILVNTGTIGVPIFFLLSGYVFSYNKKEKVIFLKDKMKRLLIPWLFIGTLVYLYVALRKNGLSFQNYIFFILGHYSYLYYLSMLVFCYLIFLFLNTKRFRCFLILISIAFLSLQMFSFIKLRDPYINPLNWMGYFSLGLIIAEKKLEGKINIVVSKYNKIFIIAFLTIQIILAYGNIELTYWNMFYFPFEIIAFFTIVSISTINRVYFNNNIIYAGKASYSIYLIHMPVAGIVARLCSYVDFWLITLLRPFIVLVLVFTFIKIVEYLSKYIKLFNKIRWLIGF